MKSFLTGALAIFSIAATSYAAEETKVVLYKCNAGAGEAAASVKITEVTKEKVKTHVGVATHSWLGGTHNTGDVSVTQIVAEDGGPTTYVDKDKKFALEIKKVEYVNRSTIVRRIDVSGDFVSKDGMKFSIPRQWLRCQK